MGGTCGPRAWCCLLRRFDVDLLLANQDTELTQNHSGRKAAKFDEFDSCSGPVVCCQYAPVRTCFGWSWQNRQKPSIEIERRSRDGIAKVVVIRSPDCEAGATTQSCCLMRSWRALLLASLPNCYSLGDHEPHGRTGSGKRRRLVTLCDDTCTFTNRKGTQERASELTLLNLCHPKSRVSLQIHKMSHLQRILLQTSVQMVVLTSTHLPLRSMRMLALVHALSLPSAPARYPFRSPPCRSALAPGSHPPTMRVMPAVL